MPARTPSAVPRSISMVRLNPSGPSPITCAATIRWPDAFSNLSAAFRSAFSLAAAFSSTIWRRSASSALRSRTFSARSAETSPKTAVTRSTCAASDVMASSAGANALRAAPRAPAAHGCWLSIASRSIAAPNARKSPVDRDGLFALYMDLVAQGPRAAGAEKDAVQGVDVLEHDAGTAHDAGQRIVRDPHRHERLMREQLIQPGEKRAAAAHDDSALDDVLDQLRRGCIESRLHGANDVDQDPRQRFADVGARHLDRFRQSSDEVAPAHEE